MRVKLQPSYVLHSRAYRDTSLLVEVFTAEHGRIGLVARGARRKSRNGSPAALLQPFAPMLLGFTGRGELKTLTATETAGRPQILVGERLYSGLYLNELLVRLLHRHDAHPKLFAAYGDALNGLASSGEIDGVLRQFELILISELGYGFELDVDGQTGAAVTPEFWPMV
ncbi:MAG: DNA repair protein RecO [Pseudomonadota bacterium]